MILEFIKENNVQELKTTKKKMVELGIKIGKHTIKTVVIKTSLTWHDNRQ